MYGWAWVNRRGDVEFLPGAPSNAVIGTHKQIIGARPALEHRARKLRRRYVDRLVRALRCPTDHPVPARSVWRRIPELVGRDRIAVGIADAEQAARGKGLEARRGPVLCRHQR